MASLNKLKVKTFDFVQAFPPSEAELNIDVPKGWTIPNGV
jgi:hypothetical protein